MARYLINDLYNSYFRSIHATRKGSDLEEKVSFAIQCTLQGIAAAWRDQQADHVVFALEGRSWRKDIYKKYKADRELKRAASTEAEIKESKAYFDGLSDLIWFLRDKTNVTILYHNELEGDDLIAGWVQTHPDDHHTIVSSDTDFYQLLAENVNQYNGITHELHTITGIFDKKGRPVIDKKTNKPKTIPDPKFILFEKCMRGDSTDFVFSAYPGVRVKGSKNKVGLIEAFADRENKGYAWNNIMLQRWVDHDGVEHKVLDDYNRNVTLIDLSAQPPNIRDKIEMAITAATAPRSNPMIGAQFLRFCGKFNLVKLSENSTTFAKILSAGYPMGQHNAT